MPRFLLAASLAVAVAACGGEPPAAPGPPPGTFNHGLLAVTQASVTTEGAPSRVDVHVEGEGTPCDRVGLISMTREGNLIDLRIETYWTQQYCIMSAVRITQDVAVKGPFPPGDYVVRVNGMVVAPFHI